MRFKQRNLNNAFAYDLVPSTSVINAALRAARRVNDFPTAVRIFEGMVFIFLAFPALAYLSFPALSYPPFFADSLLEVFKKDREKDRRREMG